MASSSSRSTTCRPEEDFYCPVCQEVFQTPVKTVSCEHVFCRKCFLTAMKGGAFCPLCRGKVAKRERAAPQRATDIEGDMRKCYGNCKCCGDQVKYYLMRQHYKTCWKYQQEYGLPMKSSHRPGQNSLGGSVLPTFKCPLCVESNFDRKGLLDHCNNRHGFQVASAVCPVCTSLPWGDPNHKSSNIVDHLNARHQFDYGEFVSLHLDEETQYEAAIAESCYVNF